MLFPVSTHDRHIVWASGGSADQRISGSADQRTSGSADQRISGPADQRTSGSADQRISGSADQRISGSADQRISGPADQRISGSADQRTSGPADQRISGSADQRISGPADQRISGSADQRISGPADQRTSGSADQSKVLERTFQLYHKGILRISGSKQSSRTYFSTCLYLQRQSCSVTFACQEKVSPASTFCTRRMPSALTRPPPLLRVLWCQWWFCSLISDTCTT